MKWGCNCRFCFEHRLDKAEAILKCSCHCHTTDEPIGHDSLCCQSPNTTHKQANQYFKEVLESNPKKGK